MKACLFSLLAAGLLWCCPALVTADTIPGRATLSGTVKAPAPFQAAQVYARHLEKDVIFMVYTSAGRYKAVNLFPGEYEVWVEKQGFESAPQKIQLAAGRNGTVDISLRAAPPKPSRQGTMFESAARRSAEVELLPYEQLYPQEPGRELAEKTCIYCHGSNFLPGNPRSQAGWEAAIKLMTGTGPGMEQWGSIIPPDTYTPEQWKTLVSYLTKNFGPGSARRALEADSDLPLDEKALANAMYVEYRMASTGPFQQRRAQEPGLDNKGYVWFTERGTPSAVSRLDPRTAVVKDYMNPDPKGSPHGLVADSEGFMWWAGRDVYLGRIHPDTGEIVQYPVAQKGWHGHTPVLDSKENIWFTMLIGNKIGKWDRATDKISLYDIPTQGGRPYGILVDPNDKVWFAEFHGCKVGMFDPVTEKFKEYPAVTQPCLMRRLGMDPKGIVWYGVFSGGKLGRIDPATEEVTEYDMPAEHSQPYDVWPDKDGNVWITDAGSRAAIIKFEPATKKFTYYPSPQWADMPKVDISRDGGIWYSPRSSAKAAVGVLYPDMSKMQATPLR